MPREVPHDTSVLASYEKARLTRTRRNEHVPAHYSPQTNTGMQSTRRLVDGLHPGQQRALDGSSALSGKQPWVPTRSGVHLPAAAACSRSMSPLIIQYSPIRSCHTSIFWSARASQPNNMPTRTILFAILHAAAQVAAHSRSACHLVKVKRIILPASLGQRSKQDMALSTAYDSAAGTHAPSQPCTLGLPCPTYFLRDRVVVQRSSTHRVLWSNTQ